MTGNIKYFLCYDVELRFGGLPVTRRVGKQEIQSYPFEKEFALSVCENMINIYGRGTHWIEDETGARVESEE